jgi:hypothetical protein
MQYEILLNFMNYQKKYKEDTEVALRLLVIDRRLNETLCIKNKIYIPKEINRQCGGNSVLWKYYLESDKEAKKIAKHLVKESQEIMQGQGMDVQEIPTNIYRLEKILVQ